ncbi:MAG TPA: DUF4159 domain-containing protein, partial [Chthoniobacterales bacterium]
MKTFLEKISRSRDLTVSVLLHVVILLALAATVAVNVVTDPPPDVISPGPLVQNDPAPARPVDPVPDRESQINPLKSWQPSSPADLAPEIIRTQRPAPTEYTVPIGQPAPMLPEMAAGISRLSERPLAEGIPADVRAAIRESIQQWQQGGGKYHFTAALAQYEGGDWNSTVRVRNQRVVGGSLPNLLYLMNKWSKDRITTNEDKVRIMRLDSGEILTQRPPFIFMTGTRDFKLTDAEVENLRKYLRLGGCVWGDSSVPGLRSRFDLAFKREMKRVIGNVDAEFENLPANHRLFREAYFKPVNSAPPGLNFYREPVSVLKMFGEVAVIYTANDYGDMWQ